MSRCSRAMQRLSLIAMACLTALPVSARLPFSSGIATDFPDGTADVIAADIDTDGDLDLVAVDHAAGQLVWRRNDRTRYRSSATLLAAPEVQRTIAADFNRDGFVDLVTVAANGSAVLHLADPDPFAPEPVYQTRPAFSVGLTDVTSLAVGRAGVAGTPELIVARTSAPHLQRFLFDPLQAGRFGPPMSLPEPVDTTGVSRVATADIDRDGLMDVIASGSTITLSLPRSTLFWVRRTGPASFGAVTVIESESALTSASAVTYPDFIVGDFDRSLGPDIAYVRDLSDRAAGAGLYLRLNAGSGFTPGTDGRTQIFRADEPTNFHRVAAGDIDRDGDVDFVLEDERNVGVTMLYRLTTTEYEIQSVGTAVTPQATAMFVHDDDVDGDPDIVVARREGEVDRYANRRIHGRAFVPGVRSAALTSAPYGALSGPLEIAPTRAARSDRPLVMFTEFTAGRLALGTLSRTNEGALQPAITPVPIATNLGAGRALSLADMDHDGDEDFLLGTGESAGADPDNQNRLVLGINGGTVYTPIIDGCQIGNDIRGVALARLGVDRPGVQGTGYDVVYTSFDDDRVAVQATDCDDEEVLTERFDSAVSGPSAVQVADLDRDGRGDVALALGRARSPGVLGDAIGFFPGLFDLEEIVPVQTAVDVVAFDYTRDGKTDLATASQGDPDADPLAGRVQLLRNQGNAAFGVPIVAAQGIHAPGRVAFGDIDHDGDNDVFFTSESTRSAAVTPPATRAQCGVFFVETIDADEFEPPVCLDDAIAMQGRYTRVALADLDRDGVDDVVATSFPDNRLGFFASDAPVQALVDHSPDANTIVLGAGEEQCPRFIDVFHLGREGDSAIRLDNANLEGVQRDAAGVVDAVILRRDDGDLVPEPGADVELARSGQNAFNFGWFLQPAIANTGVHVAATQRVRFWLCVKGRSPMPRTAQALRLIRPGAEVLDASSRDELVTSQSHPASGVATTVLAAPLFGNGFEGN